MLTVGHDLIPHVGWLLTPLTLHDSEKATYGGNTVTNPRWSLMTHNLIRDFTGQGFRRATVLEISLLFPSRLQLWRVLPLVSVDTNLFVTCFSSFKLQPYVYLPFWLAHFPSFCHASLGLWFTAGLQGRGACLLALSPEGAGITESKYVHAKSTLLKGTCRHTGPPFTTVMFLSHAGTQCGDRYFLAACL